MRRVGQATVARYYGSSTGRFMQGTRRIPKCHRGQSMATNPLAANREAAQKGRCWPGLARNNHAVIKELGQE